MNYPKRLIEVDFPIARISAHARREKSIRHGHISTLHIWWARRPLAACRAVICAALWPDPADELCPPTFREAAVELIKQFANRVFPKKITADGRLLSSEKHCSPESRARWEAIVKDEGGRMKDEKGEDSSFILHPSALREALLDFIADFANWDNSTVPAYLETSRALTGVAHQALSDPEYQLPLWPDGPRDDQNRRLWLSALVSPLSALPRPLVVDPFAGGGSIPLEALRVGADAFVSDLYPVAVLLNKVVLEYIPKYAVPVGRQGQRLAHEVRKWGQWVKEQAEKELAEFYPKDPDGATPIAYVWARTILSEAPGQGDVPVEVPLLRAFWLSKKPKQKIALRWARDKNGRVEAEHVEIQFANGETRTVRRPILEIFEPKDESQVPDETISLNELRRISVPIFGMKSWGDLFSPRQALSLATIATLISQVAVDCGDHGLQDAVRTMLAMALSKEADLTNSLCGWKPDAECPVHLFARQAVPMVWDFAESVAICESSGSWSSMFQRTVHALETCVYTTDTEASSSQASATQHPLPDDSANALITDPPYYDAAPYAYLSDFFYSWLRRSLATTHPSLFRFQEVPKDAEIVVDRPHKLSSSNKDVAFYEQELKKAFEDGRRVLDPSGLATIVFASKTTASWEAILQAVVDAGFVIAASWPIDTEMDTRVAAQGQARLASSVHLVCRPRENLDGSLREEIGEWRDVLAKLPQRIHEWMQRLAAEGVVGADAIFACLGPALEIFSKYCRVEKSNGERATLREYLEFVWGAVSSEALSLIFKDADASGLEPDARLTAMWLWTLGGANGNRKPEKGEIAKAKPSEGYTLEFDAARKIAQGLGVHLEQCESLVAINGNKAKLLPVSARTRYLFGKEAAASSRRRSKKVKQRTLFEELDGAEAEEAGWTTIKGPPPGSTTLDRVRQSMILFAANRAELLRRFLVNDGVGKDERFWKLADNLNKLYPPGTEERRWVEGVLARKKGLGL